MKKVQMFIVVMLLSVGCSSIKPGISSSDGIAACTALYGSSILQLRGQSLCNKLLDISNDMRTAWRDNQSVTNYKNCLSYLDCLCSKDEDCLNACHWKQDESKLKNLCGDDNANN